MKKFTLSFAFFGLFFLCAFSLSACSEAFTPPAADKRIKIVFEEGDFYSMERSVYSVGYGEDLRVTLNFKDGYAFRNCSYEGYDAVSLERDEVELILHDVYYPCRVRVTAIEARGGICYFLNGGTFNDASYGDVDYYIEYPDLSHHLRANTSRGTLLISREGYSLIGWNTAADGSGEHIGLGSRVTMPEDSTVFLYAEWKESAPLAAFAYETDEDGVKLISYTGDKTTEWLALPEKIEGKEVKVVSAGFADSCSIEKLVLPHTLRFVEENAFTNCSIDTVYMYDNLERVGDSSFGKIKIRTLYLNAVCAPRLQTNDNAHFAEDMDRLILNADKKKLVLTGGCSFSYGIISEELAEAFPDYFIVNMGVIGGTNAAIQFEAITRYLREGDILVHAPEQMSPYQLMYDMQVEKRIFMTCEGNYDLLSLADMRKYNSLFNDFYFFNVLRAEFEDGSYSDYCPSYNEYGDIVIERPMSEEGASFPSSETTFRLDYLTRGSVNRLCYYYDKVTAAGARVFFSYAPLNLDDLSAEDRDNRIWEAFDEKLKRYIKGRYPVISDPADYLFKGEYFYDTDYHLCTEGAYLRTAQLIEDLRAALSAGE